VGRRGPLRTIGQTGRNVELPNYTQALYEAREQAMQRMQAEAQELEATGIVGVSLNEKSHGWGSHVIEFFAIGTAIVPTDGKRTIERRPPCSTSTTSEVAEEDVPALDRDRLEHSRRGPDIVVEPRIDRALAVGIEDQQHAVLGIALAEMPVAERAGQHDEPLLGEVVHELGVLVPVVLVTQRP
jgi:hypothetical protein